jgi:hypothetical protein
MKRFFRAITLAISIPVALSFLATGVALLFVGYTLTCAAKELLK